MTDITGQYGQNDPNHVIKAVVFDCDGVLLDSRAANAALYNEILSHCNKAPLTEEQLTYVHSHTMDESLAFLFRDDGLLRKAERFWRQIDYDPFIVLLSLNPGVLECLETICRHYRTAIATSRTRTMDEVLERFGLGQFFDLVVTSKDVRYPKPHPESLNKIISFFNITPVEACYVGDSVVDQETSRRAGVPFIAYGNKDLEADHYLASFSDLPPLVERLSAADGPRRGGQAAG